MNIMVATDGKIKTVVMPTNSNYLPKGLAELIDHPWMWLIIKNGIIIGAGSEVCSSICWENAEKVGNKKD